MAPRRNWSAVAGILLGIGGVVTYFLLVFTHNPHLRRLLDTPLIHLGAVAVGIGLSLIGIRQARQRTHRGRVLAPILAALNLALTGLFVWFLFVHPAQMPEAARAPGVGTTAPDFALRDQSDNDSLEDGLQRKDAGGAVRRYRT